MNMIGDKLGVEVPVGFNSVEKSLTMKNLMQVTSLPV